MLDEWFVRDGRPALGGAAELVRYADDVVVLFERKRDAERLLTVLPERFGKYGLTIPTRPGWFRSGAEGRSDATRGRSHLDFDLHNQIARRAIQSVGGGLSNMLSGPILPMRTA